MSLIPKIELTLTPNGNLVTLTETTDIYNILYNVGGWISGITTDDIVSANVKVYNIANTLLNTFTLKSDSIDYYSNVSSNTPAPFIIIETAWTNPDGVYKTIYTIEDDNGTFYVNNNDVLFLTNLCNCKNTLVTRALNECNSAKLEVIKESLDQIELFIYGIQSAFSCGEFGRATNILEAATIYCQTVSNCGCGY